MKDGSADLRICKNGLNYLKSINDNILNFQNGLAELDSYAQSISIAKRPDNSELLFMPSEHLGI